MFPFCEDRGGSPTESGTAGPWSQLGLGLDRHHRPRVFPGTATAPA